jgi:cytochrome b
MHDAMTIYFNGEKNAGMVLVAIGIAVIVAATVLVRARPDYRSFAITLGLVALVEVAIGAGLYLKTDPQVAGLRARLDSNAAAFYAEEGARMTRVQRNFVAIEYVEVVLIIAAAVVAVARKHSHTVTGIALGLLINAAFLLAFDLLAERRGAVYLAVIEAARRV